jgi:protein tyrosine phosphatase
MNSLENKLFDLKNELFSAKNEIKALLKNGQFSQALKMVNSIGLKYLIKYSDYDLYMNVLPYDTSVSDLYGINYVNASFIQLDGDQYIACQIPKLKYFDLFLEMILRSNAECVLSLNGNADYATLHNPPSKSEIFLFENEPFLIMQTLQNVKIIKCVHWDDMAVLSLEKMEFLYNFMERFDQKLKIVHCTAGVGRTGTFIMYRALRNYQNAAIMKENTLVVTDDVFCDMWLDLRSQRNHSVFTSSQLKFLYENFVKN